MKTRITFYSVVLSFIPALLCAQSAGTTDHVQLGSGIPPSDGEMTPAVQTFIVRGDTAGGVRSEGYFREAVKTARRQGHLPSFSRWRLANQYFIDGDPVRAAAVLDDLADEAAERGDLSIEALALYYSAWVYGQAGRSHEFNQRTTKLEKLLQSQYMPVAIRNGISEWLNGPATGVARKP